MAAPKGNTNCKGKQNAKKDGAYETVLPKSFTASEKKLAAAVAVGGRAALEDELRVLKVREHRILKMIREYEKADEEDLKISTATETRGGEKETTMYFKDSAFTRVIKLQEALYKVQGRIVSVATAIRQIETDEKRMELERERLEIARLKYNGVVEVDIEDIEDEAIYE